MDKIIIHEDFKDSVYDIALLKLGKKSQFFLNLSYHLFEPTAERVDLTVFNPACLPSDDEKFVGQKGLVYGEN